MKRNKCEIRMQMTDEHLSPVLSNYNFHIFSKYWDTCQQPRPAPLVTLVHTWVNYDFQLLDYCIFLFAAY